VESRGDAHTHRWKSVCHTHGRTHTHEWSAELNTYKLKTYLERTQWGTLISIDFSFFLRTQNVLFLKLHRNSTCLQNNSREQREVLAYTWWNRIFYILRLYLWYLCLFVLFALTFFCLSLSLVPVSTMLTFLMQEDPQIQLNLNLIQSYIRLCFFISMTLI